VLLFSVRECCGFCYSWCVGAFVDDGSDVSDERSVNSRRGGE
jgi:hypothetical protein